MKPRTPDTYAEAIGLYERGLTIDPQSVDAQSRLAASLVGRVLDRMTDSAAADLKRADRLVGQVLAATPRYALAHMVKAQVLRAQDRGDEAIFEYEMALALNRNFVSALNGLAWCKLYAGSIEEAIPLDEQAIRLSPRDTNIGSFYHLIGTVHLLQSRTDDAIVWLEKARSARPASPLFRCRLAAAYALRGDIELAAAELAETQRLNGALFSSIAHVKAGQPWGVSKTRALWEASYFAGLRKAGMPEE